MTSPTFVTLLLATVFVSKVTGQGGVGSCCRKISDTEIHRDLLRRYYKQQISPCALYAIVFTTMRGKRICADPDKVWTKTSMAYLDGKSWYRQHLIKARS